MGSHRRWVATLVTDLAHCVYIIWKQISTGLNNLSFICDKCCHITVCLCLMQPNLTECLKAITCLTQKVIGRCLLCNAIEAWVVRGFVSRPFQCVTRLKCSQDENKNCCCSAAPKNVLLFVALQVSWTSFVFKSQQLIPNEQRNKIEGLKRFLF